MKLWDDAVNAKRLILASASPRRLELLQRIYPHFDVVPCPHAEPTLKSPRVAPRKWALALAYFKARSVADEHADCWVLGADTVVACDGRMFGKPRDVDDARGMLVAQARQVSEVITGVCLLRRGTNDSRLMAAEVTRVWMRDDAAERERYLVSGDWAGKAGAYGIQVIGDRLVARIEGSFSNVVGLPLERLSDLLHGCGFAVLPPGTHAVDPPA